MTPNRNSLKLRSLSRAEVRRVDERAIQEFGLPGIVLMENAGRGAVERLVALGISGPVVICAGKGNNGGDGFVMARHLEILGYDVKVLIFASRVEIRGDALIHLAVLEKSKTPLDWFSPTVDLIAGKSTGRDLKSISTVAGSAALAERFEAPGAFERRLAEELSKADWIVDALLGTGTQGPVREPLSTVIQAMNASGRKIFAVDLPSGLDCNTGKPLGNAIRACQTVTFVARKRGFDNAESREFTGEAHVVGIGAPRALMVEFAGE